MTKELEKAKELIKNEKYKEALRPTASSPVLRRRITSGGFDFGRGRRVAV